MAPAGCAQRFATPSPMQSARRDMGRCGLEAWVRAGAGLGILMNKRPNQWPWPIPFAHLG